MKNHYYDIMYVNNSKKLTTTLQTLARTELQSTARLKPFIMNLW